jgi:hypothetical protein
MGYNALPTIPNADPVVGDRVDLELTAATQLSDLHAATDAAFTPYVRVSVPFATVAAFDADVVPIEVWRIGPETQQRIGALHRSGHTGGDVRFAARFTLVREGDAWPAFGLRLLTKTTTGKAFVDRRFTDAPAYAVEGLFGKTLPWGLGPVDRIRLLGRVGFMAWQQEDPWQDDAVTFGATVQLHAFERLRVELEWRGYRGYQGHDEPMVAGVTAAWLLGSPVEVQAIVNRGIGADAPPWEFRLGVVLHIPIPGLPLGSSS